MKRNRVAMLEPLVCFLLFFSSTIVDAIETANTSLVSDDFLMQHQQQSQLQPQPQQQMNHSISMEKSQLMPESKKIIEPWSPSPQEFTPVHDPSASITFSSPPNMQPIYPSNYYLPGNQYAPAPTTEFRSEHYAYPPPPPPYEPSYPYPVAQPPMDTSLIPTAKHFVIVSFIGLLLLFAIIQNSIAAAKRKDALVEVLSNRKKRELIESNSYDAMSEEVESALKEDARIRCIQRTLCYENRKLLEDLGIFGKLLAKYLTRSVQKSLQDFSPGWDRLVEDAANAGLRGEDCDVVYRDCNFKVTENSDIDEEDEEDQE